MSAPHPVLAEPLRLPCGAVLPNRIAKAAMTEQLATRDGQPSQRLIRLYQRFAGSGAGLLITGNTMVDRNQPTEAYNVVIDDRVDLDALARWAGAAKAGGAQVWLQLSHPGRQTPKALSRRPVAPSAIPLGYAPGMFARPAALTDAEIVSLVGRFGRAAAMAAEVGFDGVELHAAHGYLISQFLSPASNQRTDRWGGSPAGRRRFLLEIVRAIRRLVPASFAVAVKLNSADFQTGGFDETESIEVVTCLNGEGVDLLEVSGGTVWLWSELYTNDRGGRGAYFASYARAVRSVARMPLMLTGGIRTATTMARLVGEGAVDVVGLARAMALVPDLPARLLNGDAVPEPGWAPRSRAPQVNVALHSFWHGLQLRRMADGADPDPGMSLARAAVELATTNTRWRLRTQR